MYKSHEAAKLTKEFWTTFGTYMAPVLSAEGEKINWINYKTGVNDIRFNLQAGKNNAFVAMEFLYADETTRQLHFNKHVGAGLQTCCRLLLNC